MNEKYIQQVLEIEKQAQGIQEEARLEAEQLPVRAQREAEALTEQARTKARTEADQLVNQAEAKAECEQILANAQEAAERMETLAMTHFDRAVTYVLDQLVGQES
jgi:vacuolar-type H+-ATPase subunit H